MHHINYKDYLDRVFGCWIGKCVAGTIGAPYEGMKELMDLKYDPSLIANMLPNDDLDLQVLWLAVLEEKGVRFTSDDLAEAFSTRCPYAPGEYAIFKKNYRRGIRPPMSGAFSNRYYVEGMGCPIRSEIWGCIAPGSPKLAAECAAKDGVLDHQGNSVYAEQFLAGIEAAAFVEHDLDKLVEIGLTLIPKDSKIARLIRDVRGWCKSSDDWRYVRSRIIRDYGHPDCTNSFQNIGVTLLALYFGGMDLIKTTMIALNCGFDTDCTCATAGSLIGIIKGADALMKEHGLGDQGYKLGVDAPRRSDRLLDLAEDTCAMGLHFAEHLNKDVLIENAPAPPDIELPVAPPVSFSVEYDGIPAIGIGDSRRVRIHPRNNTPRAIWGRLSLRVPEGWLASSTETEAELIAGQSTPWGVMITAPDTLEVLNGVNFCEVTFTPTVGEPVSYRFGLAGAAVWQAFGPFWQNNVEMPALALGEHYTKYIGGSDDNDYADNIRTYHLNTRVDPDREYMTLEELTSGGVAGDASKEPRLFNAYEDRFSVNEIVGFQGPCAVYLVRRVVSPEDRTVGIHIGHTDAYSLWINGEMVSKRDHVDWWTAENVHVLRFPLKKGTSTIVVKLCRRSASADFSLVFAKGGPCTEHYIDFGSVNPGREDRS